MFSMLVIGDNNDIQLKACEYVSSNSTYDKIMLYGQDNSHLIGFKIDIRFIYDFEDQEYDLCDIEVCLSNENEEKLYGGQGKLSCEGKTNTSMIYQISRDKSRFKLWVIQAFGLRAFLSTVVHTASHLHFKYKQVVIFQDKIVKIRHTIEAKLEADRYTRHAESLSNVYSSSSPQTQPRKNHTLSTRYWHTPSRNGLIRSAIPSINKRLLGRSEASNRVKMILRV
ncbi:unnamed protein product [Mucor hiemalis]